MKEINKKKFIDFLEFLKINISNSLKKSIKQDFEFFISMMIKYSLQTKSFENESEVKILLFGIIEQQKKKFNKIISEDVYNIIFEKLNEFFPVFPFDLEEYQFKKLMEKTFEEDCNNSYYFDLSKCVLRNNTSKKYYKYY